MHRRLISFVILGALTARAGAACWHSRLEGSHVTFEVMQSGSPMQGAFKIFAGKICVDPDDPSRDAVSVNIDTASIDIKMPKVNQALRGSDLLNVERWPNARFDSTAIKAFGDDHYRAEGALHIKGVRRDISVPFELHRSANNSMKAVGSFSIKRLDYGVGEGQWNDTGMIGDTVKIEFTVALVPMK